MGYYEAPKQSFRRCCIERNIFRQHQSLQITATKLGLEDLKKDNVPPSFVTEKIALHLHMKKGRCFGAAKEEYRGKQSTHQH